MLDIFIALSLLYFLPTLIARWRGLGDVGTYFWLNLCAGWSGLGWLYLLGHSLTQARPAAE
jgi:hypothetical protein